MSNISRSNVQKQALCSLKERPLWLYVGNEGQQLMWVRQKEFAKKSLGMRKTHIQPAPPEKNFKKDMVFELGLKESSSLRLVEKERGYSRQKESRP